MVASVNVVETVAGQEDSHAMTDFSSSREEQSGNGLGRQKGCGILPVTMYRESMAAHVSREWDISFSALHVYGQQVSLPLLSIENGLPGGSSTHRPS